MSMTTQAILGATLPLAVPLLLAAMEVLSMRRRPRPDGDDHQPPQHPVAPRPTGGQKPLPDCLIPRMHAPVRARVLERV